MVEDTPEGEIIIREDINGHRYGPWRVTETASWRPDLPMNERVQNVLWTDLRTGKVERGARNLGITPEGDRAYIHHPTGKVSWRVCEPIPIFQATKDIGEKAAEALIGRMLDESHYTLLLDKTGRVLTPDGRGLCALYKNKLNELHPGLVDAVRPLVRKAARNSVAGGNRPDAAGAGRVKRKRKDGSESNMTGTPRLEDLDDEHYQILKPARDGAIGFFKRGMRGGATYPCRLTAYKGVLPEEFGLMSELAHQVSMTLRDSHAQKRWDAQFAKALQTPTDFLLKTPQGPTVFTTITCNKNWRTAAHIDSGDLKHGFGAMCSFGKFEGCDLVFPRYKVAVRYREGDILLADVGNQVHGNTRLLNPDGTVPKGKRVPERLVCVFYFQEGMEGCLDAPEAEMYAANNHKNGESSRKGKS